ncbi:MAG: class I SAM-dependent methyltransferase [Chloroflexota bacterium]
MIGLREIKRPYVPKTPIVAKEVPYFIDWVPTGLNDIHYYFDLAPVSALDTVYDLGSGDGRLVLAALAKGAGKSVGVELDSELIQDAKKAARLNGYYDNINFIQDDFMKVHLAQASVVLCYLSPVIYETLKPKFASELKSGARIVTQAWGIPGWQPARSIMKEGQYFYLYIMPPKKLRAKVV